MTLHVYMWMKNKRSVRQCPPPPPPPHHHHPSPFPLPLPNMGVNVESGRDKEGGGTPRQGCDIETKEEVSTQREPCRP